MKPVGKPDIRGELALVSTAGASATVMPRRTKLEAFPGLHPFIPWPMHDPEPVTQWLSRARAGDESALQELWQHYFQRLVRLARGRMAVLSRSVYDEEDAALSAMHSFFRGMKDDRFPRLDGRHNLWRLLVVIVSRKIGRRRQMATADKRGGDATTDAGLLDAIDHEPTPDFVAEMLDDLQNRLDSLPDQGLRRIALLTLDGLSQVEIARAMNCTVRTIHRKLDTIRAVWEDAQL